MVVVEVSATGRGESELCRPATDPAISSGRHLKFWSPSPDCVSKIPDFGHVWILRMFAKGGNESLGTHKLVLHVWSGCLADLQPYCLMLMLKQASRLKRVKNTKGGTIQCLSRAQLTFLTLATLVFLPTSVGRGLPCYWNISRLECTTYMWWVSRATARPALLWVPLSMTTNDDQWQWQFRHIY